MGLCKQAKTLSDRQVVAVLAYLETTRNPLRNAVILLLSVKAGLRAKEIAALTWNMLTDSDGNPSSMIALPNAASKGRSGRSIPINKQLQRAIEGLRRVRGNSPYVITSQRRDRTSAAAIVNLFATWYRDLGFIGCSSHSGRRTFITKSARKISTVGGSLRDVQALAGHAALSTTQRYIETDVAAQRKVVDLI